jgi:hypothetical protein
MNWRKYMDESTTLSAKEQSNPAAIFWRMAFGASSSGQNHLGFGSKQ